MNQFAVIVSRLSESFLLNARLFASTLIFSIPLGLLIAFGSMSRFRPLRSLVRIIVWMVRGTPLMLQLMIIFYGPGLLKMSFTWPGGASGRFLAATVAFVINYACYFSEIF
jgi:polar amino acid transport system permease protein